MPYLRDLVFVLKKEPFREQDRRYYLYGQEYGLLVAVARGASSKKSKQAGHLEPFSVSEVMLAKGKGFDKLAVAKQVRPPRSGGLTFYTVAGRLSDLVIALIRPGVADERIFFLLEETSECLSDLEAEPSLERARFVFSAASLKLLDLLGFAPDPKVASEEVRQLAAFARRAPLANVLRLTAPKSVLNDFSAFVEESLSATHLDDPHALLGKTARFLG